MWRARTHRRPPSNQAGCGGRGELESRRDERRQGQRDGRQETFLSGLVAWWYHTNTQLFNTIDEHNRFKIGEAVTAPWNAPPEGARPTMDGFVTDYISTFTGEVGRQPTYQEYAQIMTGHTPDQVPVLSGIARAQIFPRLAMNTPRAGT